MNNTTDLMTIEAGSAIVVNENGSLTINGSVRVLAHLLNGSVEQSPAHSFPEQHCRERKKLRKDQFFNFFHKLILDSLRLGKEPQPNQKDSEQHLPR